mmetsp:Transcript_55348/g.134421  ORF Transcript_55348/g.134421 Transcript_55348/m.134421 type:complete len:367 (+) Transcript_55348:567-1667(+)
MKEQQPTLLHVGMERFNSDKRQLGGLLMFLSTAALIFPMANLATLVGPDGTTAKEGIPLVSLIASVLVVVLGILGIAVGYLQSIHDYGHKYLTMVLLIWNQFAWIPFITDMVAVGRGAASGAAFIDEAYEPSATDVKFVGSMGIMGILGYGTGFLGSVALAGFALYAFQSGKPGDRPGSYYRSRMPLYVFALGLVGLAQLLLGSYILSRFGGGPLPNGHIGVAMFMVNFPEISVAVGTLQTLTAVYGAMRAYGVRSCPNDNSYQAVLLFAWIATVTLQIMVQVAYNPAGMAAAAAPSQTMLTMGIFVINGFLDFKARATPSPIPLDYYHHVESEESDTLKNLDGEHTNNNNENDIIMDKKSAGDQV